MNRSAVTSRAAVPDEELLGSADPQAFGVFYARHLAGVEAYFARRVEDRETAADLAAETFASALVARRRFVPGSTPAAGWLYTIAARRFVDLQRRRVVAQRTREAAMLDAVAADRSVPAPPVLLAAELEAGLLRHLPTDQREALAAHVVQGRDYGEIALDLQTSEAAIRQRVSRGLRALRGPLRVYRAAQELAREDRAYRYGGGHGTVLSRVGPRDPLDCSSSASLILLRGGLFDPGRPWISGRFADQWGQLGEGRYLTVWANGEHVWLEFKLDADHGERFDPTPSRLAPNSGWLSRRPGPTRELTPRHWPGL
jgi:RNA polymerase sigma-70 factor (ECF subfamily)